LVVTGAKVFRVFLLATVFTVTSAEGLSESGLKLVCYVNIVYGNLKSENSEDYAQKAEMLRS
jgi:hypothetical protein